ncbi:uncharacterized protein LOC123226751 [Mangifera indica]|uniref:uncharacterized protein LOC123226751 n=1 Tax=Mangifera indica TaxID=29780 RepID=UPI001CFA6271|nr:uncharacterized protein LOC123226751 [Mangifera indica]
MSDPSQSEHEASDVEIQNHDSQLCGNLKGIFAKLLSFFDIETTWGCRLYIAAYLIVVLMHPLHYYAYVIKPEQNCLEIGIGLYAALEVALGLNLYLTLYSLNFIGKRFEKGRSYIWRKYHFFLPQIPVLFMTSMVIIDVTGRNQERIFSITVNLILFLYIVLLIGLSSSFKKAIENNSDCYLAKAKWGKAAINLFLYFLGGHVS